MCPATYKEGDTVACEAKSKYYTIITTTFDWLSNVFYVIE